MARSPRTGFSIVELLVAMLLVELAALAALGAIITTHRIDGASRRGAATDLQRQSAVRLIRGSSGCTGAALPTVQAFSLPATTERPPLTARIRCGR